MTSFKQFVTEKIISKPVQKNLQVKQCITLLNKHCKQGLSAISNGGLLFRGIDTIKTLPGYMMVDTSTLNRTSRDTSNGYQMLMDNLKSFDKFPKRSSSLICASSYGVAARYATSFKIYVAIPFDGAKVAVSSTSDVLKTNFMRINVLGLCTVNLDIVDLNSFLDEFLEGCGIKLSGSLVNFDLYNKKLSALEPIKIIHALTQTSEYDGPEADFSSFKNFKNHVNKNNKFKKQIAFLEANNHDILSAIFKSFTPDNMGVTLMTFGNTLPSGKECWVSGKSILIRHDLFSEILDELKKDGFPIHKQYKKL